jgi:hypothetical protein
MTGVRGYARTLFVGGVWRPAMLPTFREEVARLHEVIEDLGRLIERGGEPSIRPDQLLQGPLGGAGEFRVRQGRREQSGGRSTTAGISGSRVESGDPGR